VALQKELTKVSLAENDMPDEGIKNIRAQAVPPEGLPHIVKLETVPNCRDMGGYNTIYGCKTKMGLVFRSATLDFARDGDADWIYNTLNTIIDFRDPEERRKALANIAQQKNKPDESKRYPVSIAEAIKADVTEDEKNPHECCHHVVEEPSPYATVEERYVVHDCLTIDKQRPKQGDKAMFRIPLAARHAMRKFVLKQLSIKQAAHFCYLRWALGQPDEAQKYIMPLLGELGLGGFYKLLVDSCHHEILMVLRVIANPDYHPICFHCSHGKDRTGLTAALVLSVLGVSREDVIFDYSVTASLIPEAYLAQFKRDFHFCEEWAETPEHVMRDVLQYLDDKYGSISAYLVAIGFSRKEQQSMRKVLLGVEGLEEAETEALSPLASENKENSKDTRWYHLHHRQSPFGIRRGFKRLVGHIRNATASRFDSQDPDQPARPHALYRQVSSPSLSPSPSLRSQKLPSSSSSTSSLSSESLSPTIPPPPLALGNASASIDVDNLSTNLGDRNDNDSAIQDGLTDEIRCVNVEIDDPASVVSVSIKSDEGGPRLQAYEEAIASDIAISQLPVAREADRDVKVVESQGEQGEDAEQISGGVTSLA